MIKLKDILTEAMSDAEIKKMHQKYKDTGELPAHLKKMLKGKKAFEKKFKVKDIVVPGLEWMADIGESINEVGFKPTVYHFKRATASTMDELDAELHRKGFRPGGMGWKGKGGVDFNKRTLTMQTSAIPNNNIKLNKIAKKYGGKLIVFNGKKVKGGEVKSFEIESINEAPDHDLFKKLKKVDDQIIKLLMHYTARADVGSVARSWMAGLHAKLKKVGIKI